MSTPTLIRNSLTGAALQLPYFVRLLNDGRWALYCDSSMLRLFSDCERKFWFRYILGYTQKGRPYAMNIGSWWSHVMEHYYKAMADGKLDKGVACELAVHFWEQMKMDELLVHAPKSMKGFIGQNKSALGAVLVLITQYYDQFFDYDSTHWKIIATEAGFGLKGETIIGENDFVVVHYVGKPDLFVLEDDKWLKPVDHKTKERINSKLQHCWKPHHQTAGYIAIGQQLCKELGLDTVVDRCIINITGRSEPSDKPRDGVKKARFLRVPPQYSQDELVEWRERTVKLATRMRQAIETNDFRWNEDACHIYSGCSYRSVDAVPRGSREVVLNSNFVKIEPWVPYQVEDEDEEL